MTAFSAEDVAEIERGGNAAFNAKYLARSSARDFILPNFNDTAKLRDFIRAKYVEKKWYSDDGVAEPSSAAPAHAASVPNRRASVGPSAGGAAKSVAPLAGPVGTVKFL